VNKLRSRRKVKSTSKKKPLPKKKKSSKSQNKTPTRTQPAKVEIAELVVEMKADEKKKGFWSSFFIRKKS
jgi:hypothetical protein